MEVDEGRLKRQREEEQAQEVAKINLELKKTNNWCTSMEHHGGLTIEQIEWRNLGGITPGHKVWEFGERATKGCTITEAKAWLTNIRAAVDDDLRQALGGARAEVTEGTYTFQVSFVPSELAELRSQMTDGMTTRESRIKGVSPKIRLENRPDRIAKYSTMGCLSDAIAAEASEAGLEVKADWQRTLSIKVHYNGDDILVAGVSASAGPIWHEKGKEMLKWGRQTLEMQMKK
ncbi:unnamed protein product [Prorocentrum cordatum]|uniref:Uncharacterized protein n=1 Tax=Prorocentrum cordatum TaxID=2364126 RepID=A0ABN9TKY7_9DINO|nr:unnamed protein product [Polarella glacialis]